MGALIAQINREIENREYNFILYPCGFSDLVHAVGEWYKTHDFSPIDACRNYAYITKNIMKSNISSPN